MSFEYHRAADPSARGLRLRPRKCLHIYKYYLHPVFGFLGARLQTWFPFNVQIWLNGREWLARQLQSKGRIDFVRHDNCFTELGNPALAQRLIDQQLSVSWKRLLDSLARTLNPLHRQVFKSWPLTYYWSAYQPEWATDLLFRDPEALAAIYPALVRHAMLHFDSADVLRFLGRKGLHGKFQGNSLHALSGAPKESASNIGSTVTPSRCTTRPAASCASKPLSPKPRRLRSSARWTARARIVRSSPGAVAKGHRRSSPPRPGFPARQRKLPRCARRGRRLHPPG